MASGSPVVPRWEWRVFGDRFPTLAAALDTRRAPLIKSTETYLVGAGDEVNVKIRKGAIDIKRRLRVAQDLELWSPVLKAEFPIGVDTIAAIFQAWRLQAPVLDRQSYTPDQFVNDVIPAAGVRVAHVTKARRQALIGTCLVELASLTVDGEPTQTAAVESEHPDEIPELARTLGLAGVRNESYVAALRRLLLRRTERARAGAREGAIP